MSANTRKPVCPACDGYGAEYDTVDIGVGFQTICTAWCSVCDGTGHTSKRAARRWKRAEHLYLTYVGKVPTISTDMTDAEINDVLNSIVF